ncbi:unnamed protein product [Phytophthora lilii]|uniref:Unnamed protein product n=1 Tax=Phytophthora lilii TaxID=2077276 RepID=A0A9W6XG64_9STRA|nr:unnamed protein product [Phytophthora lilii]
MMIHQKRQLIEKASEGPAMAQHELAAWAKPCLQAQAGPRPVNDLRHSACSTCHHKRGIRQAPQATGGDVAGAGEKVWAWIQFVEAQNVCISRELIRMKAQHLQKELCDAWDLRFSDGWLTGFERHHALRYRKRHGEAASADTAAIYLGRQQLQDITDQYEPQNVYKLDETGLCYAMAPSRSICTRGARGVKKTKTRITVALTSNADGSDTLPPLFWATPSNPTVSRSAQLPSLASSTRPTRKRG